jgi:hypothetical protein
MNGRGAGAGSPFMSPDDLAVEAELQDYAARVAPGASAAFMDRAIAAAERSPLPRAGFGPRVRAMDVVRAAGMRLRLARAQVAGGPSIPLRLRVQAGVMLVVVALLVTAGAALAAAGAATVVTWVAGPSAQTAGSLPSVAPTLSSIQTSETPQPSDHPDLSNTPANGNRPSQNPGNGNQPSQNPGNGNQPSQNPGNCGPSQNPGNHGQPSQNPGGRPSSHPNASSHPGNGSGPGQNPRPTAPARP